MRNVASLLVVCAVLAALVPITASADTATDQATILAELPQPAQGVLTQDLHQIQAGMASSDQTAFGNAMEIYRTHLGQLMSVADANIQNDEGMLTTPGVTNANVEQDLASNQQLLSELVAFNNTVQQ